MKALDTVWTTANCEKLRNWWEIEGKTAPEIMAELVNWVIGSRRTPSSARLIG